jgi:SAM-dependent methyltransferase
VNHLSDRAGVTSAHYAGEDGSRYFEWQNQFGARSGKIEARKFARAMNADSTLLDFGCGSGHLLNALEAKQKIGLEINPYAVAHAEKLGIKVFSDISEIPSESVDIVISNHALEHVPFPLDSIKEIRRVMKSGGKLSICIPIDDWRRAKKFHAQDINNHLHTWTPQLIGNLFVEAGFDPKKLKISILRKSWFPGTKYLWKFEWLFDALCTVYCVVKRNGYQIILSTVK